jgi:hypothetical protein
MKNAYHIILLHLYYTFLYSCDKDETIRHYTYGMSSVQRFSMQAFRFISQHRFVYLHCDLVVCHRYDSNSTCSRSTSCSQRFRRDVGEKSDDVSGMYALSFGPIMQQKQSADENTGGAYDKYFKNNFILTDFKHMHGFGCMCGLVTNCQSQIVINGQSQNVNHKSSIAYRE